MSSRSSVDFHAISTAALAVARRLLSEWLPGGDWSGDEYKPRNPTRDDKRPGSFVINAQTGKSMPKRASGSITRPGTPAVI